MGVGVRVNVGKWANGRIIALCGVWIWCRWSGGGRVHEKGVRVGLHFIFLTLTWERGYLFIPYLTLIIWYRTNRPNFY